jgi:hypothetical protein
MGGDNIGIRNGVFDFGCLQADPAEIFRDYAPHMFYIGEKLAQQNSSVSFPVI